MISKGLMILRLTAGNTSRPLGNIGRMAVLISPDFGYRLTTHNLFFHPPNLLRLRSIEP